MSIPTQSTGKAPGGKALSRRYFLRASLAASAGMALAACAPAPTATSVLAPTAVATPADTAAPAVVKGIKGKITWWHHQASETEQKGLKEAADALKVKQPDLEVVMELIPNADFMAKFTAAAQGGGLPDVTMAAVQRLPDMVAMKGLVDITDKVNASGFKANYPDSLWQGATVNGKIYAVPAFLVLGWYYYRVDWFKDAGLSVPETWDQLLEAAKKLTDPAKNRYGYGMRGGDGGYWHLLDVIEAYGSPLVDANNKPAMDAKKATDAVRFAAEMYTKHKVCPQDTPNAGYQQISTAFKTGQTAMVPTHTGSLGDIRTALDQSLFMSAQFPAGPAKRVTRVIPIYIGIAKKDNIDAAWQVVANWFDKDVQVQHLLTAGYFAPSTAATSDTRVTSQPVYKAASEGLKNAVLLPSFPGAAGWMEKVVTPAFQKVLIGTATAEAAVDEMIKGLEKAVA